MEIAVWLAENHEWVGVCGWIIDSTQSVAPATGACVQPGLSNPPGPSKVSVNVPVATGPVGAVLRSIALASSTELAASTARTT